MRTRWFTLLGVSKNNDVLLALMSLTGCITVEQILELDIMSESVVRNSLSYLVKNRYAKTTDTYFPRPLSRRDRSTVYSLTKAGALHLQDVQYKVELPTIVSCWNQGTSTALSFHSLATVDILYPLLALRRDTLPFTFVQEDARDVFGATTFRPDATLTYGANTYYFELDTGTERQAALCEKCERYTGLSSLMPSFEHVCIVFTISVLKRACGQVPKTHCVLPLLQQYEKTATLPYSLASMSEELRAVLSKPLLYRIEKQGGAISEELFLEMKRVYRKEDVENQQRAVQTVFTRLFTERRQVIASAEVLGSLYPLAYKGLRVFALPNDAITTSCRQLLYASDPTLFHAETLVIGDGSSICFPTCTDDYVVEFPDWELLGLVRLTQCFAKRQRLTFPFLLVTEHLALVESWLASLQISIGWKHCVFATQPSSFVSAKINGPLWVYDPSQHCFVEERSGD